MTNRKVHWKVGNLELEVEGEDDFVDAQLKRFNELVDQGGKPESTAYSPVQLRPPSTDLEASAKRAKELSPSEYVREKKPDTGTQQLVVLAKYLEDNRGLSEFGKKEVNALAAEAKLKGLHSQYFTYAVQQGLLRTTAKGKYAITLSGEDLVVRLPKSVSATT